MSLIFATQLTAVATTVLAAALIRAAATPRQLTKLEFPLRHI